MPRRRIVFMGSPGFAIPALDRLAESHDIMAVYSQPPRRAGRGMQEHPQPVAAHAATLNIPAFHPQRLSDAGDLAILAGHDADMFVVVAYGLLLPRRVLDMPRFGCINGHASLLPRWRGAAPIQRAIEAGDAETGVTIMQMDVGLDTGDMLNKVFCEISASDTGGSLHDKLAEIGPPALLQTLQKLERSELQAETQDESLANYAHKLSKEEAQIDWTLSVSDIERKVRAFNPFPVCFSTLGEERVRIFSASYCQSRQNAAPGTIVSADKTLDVACSDGVLKIERLQLPGKKQVSAQEAINGFGQKLAVGSRFVIP